MVVGDELSPSPAKVPFAQQYDTMQALLLHRADKPFRMRVGVSSQLHHRYNRIAA
jgi:hypothetical protein